MIYLDNAATTYPKPPGVLEAVTRFMLETGGNPARSGHRMSVDASRVVYDARERIAELVGLGDPLKVAFTANCTTAVNCALRGLLCPGDHVITTGIEHNAVMRPLRCLEQKGIDLAVVPCDAQGLVAPDDIASEIRANTRMVVMTHASNVLGCVEPIAEVGRICRELGVLLLVDAAQTLGAVPVHIGADCIDLLAFAGHKSLYGPQGIGGLVIGDHVDLSRMDPVICGGTGSRSESEEQPDFLPDMLEAGTLNGPGIAGLAAGIGFVLSTGVDVIRRHEIALTDRLMQRIIGIPGVTVYGPTDLDRRVAVVSFNVGGLDPAVAAMQLDEQFGIMCRAGLHCAPAAHRTAGTFPRGSIRFGLSWFTSDEDVEGAVRAVRELAK